MYRQLRRRLLLLLLAAAGHRATAELRLALYNNTAFGGALASNATVPNIDGASSVGCNQSAELVGTLTAPPASSLLSFGALVDPDASCEEAAS
jgi:hypothetical protein